MGVIQDTCLNDTHNSDYSRTRISLMNEGEAISERFELTRRAVSYVPSLFIGLFR